MWIKNNEQKNDVSLDFLSIIVVLPYGYFRLKTFFKTYNNFIIFSTSLLLFIALLIFYI